LLKKFQPKVLPSETVDGDLDGDKIPEKVIVYNTKDNELGTSVKFRSEKDKW
jgi:hypothetical protein